MIFEISWSKGVLTVKGDKVKLENPQGITIVIQQGSIPVVQIRKLVNMQQNLQEEIVSTFSEPEEFNARIVLGKKEKKKDA